MKSRLLFTTACLVGVMLVHFSVNPCYAQNQSKNEHQHSTTKMDKMMCDPSCMKTMMQMMQDSTHMKRMMQMMQGSPNMPDSNYMKKMMRLMSSAHMKTMMQMMQDTTNMKKMMQMMEMMQTQEKPRK